LKHIHFLRIVPSEIRSLRFLGKWSAPVLVVCATLTSLVVPARAESGASHTTETPLSHLSPYERGIASRILAERGKTVEPAPQGKWIDGIDVEPLEVFEREDPLPGWVNWFHTTSRVDVIEREILARPGQRYDSNLVDESARNLRSLRQLSLVLILPVKSGEDRVRLLVITKDVWSLRLNSALRMRTQSIEYLALQPSEENLAGRHLRLAGQYIYDLSTNTFGATLSHQRLFGSRLALFTSVNLIQHRATGKFEGSTGSFTFEQPLYSSRTKWAYGTSLKWAERVHRYLLPDGNGGYTPRLFDDRSTPEAENIPYRFRSRQLAWQTYVQRSYGYQTKVNMTFGMEANQRRFNARNLIDEGYDPDEVRVFERKVLERSNVRLGPFFMLEAYRNRFVSLYDVETLGLQEDYRLGPQAFVKFYTGSKRALSTRDLLGVSNGLRYTASFSRSLLHLWAVHTAEISPTPTDSDGLIQGGVRVVSPSVVVGRFVYDGGAVYRYQDYRNFRFALGGEGRLRGYPSEQFLGRNVVTSNLEFRSRSLGLFGVLFGLVGFYDVGDAFDSKRLLAPKHSVGFGGRATAPQLQRVAMRLDVAFPLTTPRPELGERWGKVDVFFTLEGQAFPFPTPVPSSQRTPLFPLD
jgi:hypothetical protein